MVADPSRDILNITGVVNKSHFNIMLSPLSRRIIPLPTLSRNSEQKLGKADVADRTDKNQRWNACDPYPRAGGPTLLEGVDLSDPTTTPGKRTRRWAVLLSRPPGKMHFQVAMAGLRRTTEPRTVWLAVMWLMAITRSLSPRVWAPSKFPDRYRHREDQRRPRCDKDTLRYGETLLWTEALPRE